VQNQAAAQNRIAGAVNSGSRVALPGSIGGRARHSTDLGLASADRKLESLSVRFSMTPAQQADLNQFLAAQLDPSSPSYHQWLTSEQFGARFGLSSSDLAKVSSWSPVRASPSPASQEFHLHHLQRHRRTAAGPRTTIHNVSHNGRHITNLTDPTCLAIANVVLGVTGLDDFRLKPAGARAAHQ
jgi:hypothetical protein